MPLTQHGTRELGPRSRQNQAQGVVVVAKPVPRDWFPQAGTQGKRGRERVILYQPFNDMLSTLLELPRGAGR